MNVNLIFLHKNKIVAYHTEFFAEKNDVSKNKLNETFKIIINDGNIK